MRKGDVGVVPGGSSAYSLSFGLESDGFGVQKY